jgi:hypothetical protein
VSGRLASLRVAAVVAATAAALWAGCKDADLAVSADQVACILPLSRATCVTPPASWSQGLTPGTSVLADCFLFETADGGPEAYRSTWQELDSGGLPTACDQGGIALSRPLASPTFEGGPPLLVCNPPRGQSCDTSDSLTGSVVQCGFKPGGFSANLGPGVSAASLGSDGKRLAAAWLGEADASGDSGRLHWQLYDDNDALVDIPPGVAMTNDCPGVSNARTLGGARLWAPPRVTSSGEVELFAVGLCAYNLAAAGTPTLQKVTFSAAGASSQPVCIDVGGRVSGLAWGHATPADQSDDDVWLAMAVDCEQGEGLFGGQCPGNGLLVQKTSAFTRAGTCDDDQQPLVEAPASESVPWVDGAQVTFDGDPVTGVPGQGQLAAAVHVGQSTPAQVIARLYSSTSPGLPPMPPVDLDVLTSAAGALQSQHTRDHYAPAMAVDKNAVVLAFAEPSAGLVVSQLVYRADRMDLPPRWQHFERVVLAGGEPEFSPAPAFEDEKLQPQVAVDPEAPTDGYATCHVSGVDSAVPELRNITLVQVRGPHTDFTNTQVVGETVACAVAAGRPGSGIRYKVLIVDAVRRILLTVPSSGDQPGIPAAEYPDLPGFPADVRSLQVRGFQDRYYALVESRPTGAATSSYLVYRLTPDPAVVGTVDDVATTDRPRLQVDDTGVYVSYAATSNGAAVLRRLQVLPAMQASDMALTLQPTRGVIIGDKSPMLVYGGPYLNHTASSGEGAWVRLGGADAPARRLTRRMPEDVSQPAVLPSSNAQPQPQVLYASGGLRASQLPSSVESYPVVSNLARRGDVTGLAVSQVPGTDGSTYGVVLYTTADTVYLNTFPLNNSSMPLADEGREITLFGGKTLAAPSAPALVPLGQGILGISICHQHDPGNWVRVLAPVDFGGQLLGPPFDFGAQVQKGMSTCPPATLLDHGGRLLSSFLENDQTRIAELECVTEPSP